MRRVDGVGQLLEKEVERPRKTWWETLRYDVNYKFLTKDMTIGWNDWPTRILPSRIKASCVIVVVCLRIKAREELMIKAKK